MMASSNGNHFPRHWPLWGVFTGARWIPRTKGLWCFLWSAPEPEVEQWRCRWFETPSRSLWRHCNVFFFVMSPEYLSPLLLKRFVTYSLEDDNKLIQQKRVPLLLQYFFSELWCTSRGFVASQYKKRCNFRKFLTTLIKLHDDVIRRKLFPRYWPFVRGIRRPLVNSPHKGQWHGALMFSSICAWTNDWIKNRDAGDLRHHHAHYDVTILLAASSMSLHSMQPMIRIQMLLQSLCRHHYSHNRPGVGSLTSVR